MARGHAGIVNRFQNNQDSISRASTFFLKSPCRTVCSFLKPCFRRKARKYIRRSILTTTHNNNIKHWTIFINFQFEGKTELQTVPGNQNFGDNTDTAKQSKSLQCLCIPSKTTPLFHGGRFNRRYKRTFETTANQNRRKNS